MTQNLDKKSLIAAVYAKEYNKFLVVAFGITRDIEEARDAVQEGFYRLLIAHVDGPLICISSAAMQHIKWAIYNKKKEIKMEIKHSYSYGKYNEHLLDKSSTPNIEYYPYLQRALKNIQHLSIKERIVVKHYIMDGESRR